MVTWIAVLLGSFVAGTLQTVTGFGSVMLMMMVFPFFFSILDAPTLSLSINMLYCIILAIQYRKDIDWRVTIPPTLVFSAVTFLITGLVGSADLTVLVIAFAIFLIGLSIYYLSVASKVRAKPRPTVGIVCGALAGICAGLFALGGPPIAPYFLAATKNHKSYVASMQLLFLIANFVNLGGRMLNGIFNWSLWPYMAAGSVCILGGMVLGEKAAEKINPDKTRIIVYAFVGITGVVLLLQQLL